MPLELTDLNQFFSKVIAKQGYETGAFIRQEIDAALNLTEIDLEALTSRINAISKVLDGDSDEEFSAQNIIKLISDNNAAVAAVASDLTALSQVVAANTQAITTINGDETTQGSFKKAVKDAKDLLTIAINEAKSRANEAYSLAEEGKSIAQDGKEKAELALSKVGEVGTKGVDESEISNGKGLIYNGTTGKLEYVDIATQAEVNLAVQELQEQINSKSEIDDTAGKTVTDKTYSAKKINELVDEEKTQRESEITRVDERVDSVENRTGSIENSIDSLLNSCSDLSLGFTQAMARGKSAVQNGTYLEADRSDCSKTGVVANPAL